MAALLAIVRHGSQSVGCECMSLSMAFPHVLSSIVTFFVNDTATAGISTLSLHDALPILDPERRRAGRHGLRRGVEPSEPVRSEEHTSELQSLRHLVCRLMLEKKNENRHISGSPSDAGICEIACDRRSTTRRVAKYETKHE